MRRFIGRASSYLVSTTSPRRSHNVPSVTGRFVRVNQNHARGAAAGGLLKFIGPSPVIRESLAAEKVRFGLGRRRIVDHYHQDFAPIIRRAAAVIVPFGIGSVSAVAGEYQFGIDRDFRLLRIRPGDELITELERLWIAFVRRYMQGRARVRFNSDQPDVLQIAVS